jgi:glycosyltransferase involved in cell wall biosynthesis
MVMLEAMAAGVPVVATDIPGVRELLTGECGVLVRPGSVREMADAIASVLEDDGYAGSLRYRALARQRSRYNALAMCESIFDVYGALITPRTVAATA